MTVTFRIENYTPESVKLVMLRKFFQMVFAGTDSLHIYTATVLGGKAEAREDTTGKQTKYISELDKLPSFCMKFDFIITGNDNNDVISISSEDVTEGDRGFLDQIGCIQRVWGEQCIIRDKQDQLSEKLGALVGTVPDPDKTAKLAGKNLLWIQDDRKASEKEMVALAIPGSVKADDYSHSKIGSEKKSEGSEQAFYSIRVPKDTPLAEGIELVNWVKTTVKFKHKIRDGNLNFCIVKDNEKTEYIAPDFTWYFSPPAKTRISNETSIVETVSKKPDCDMNCKFRPDVNPCTCPIKKHFNTRHATMTISNAINPVANKTTVNFARWTKDEQIDYRQKYRLASKNVLKQSTEFKDLSEINMYLDLADEHGRGNRQFILSIFIAFALAFGVDTARLNVARRYFFDKGLFNAELQWLFLMVLLSLNLFIRPPHTKREQGFHIWRMSNIILSSLWALYVFIFSESSTGASAGIWVSNVITNMLNSISVNVVISVYTVMQRLLDALILSDLLYAAINIIKFRDPILSGIFQDDIL